MILIAQVGCRRMTRAVPRAAARVCVGLAGAAARVAGPRVVDDPDDERLLARERDADDGQQRQREQQRRVTPEREAERREVAGAGRGLSSALHNSDPGPRKGNRGGGRRPACSASHPPPRKAVLGSASAADVLARGSHSRDRLPTRRLADAQWHIDHARPPSQLRGSAGIVPASLRRTGSGTRLIRTETCCQQRPGSAAVLGGQHRVLPPPIASRVPAS